LHLQARIKYILFFVLFLFAGTSLHAQGSKGKHKSRAQQVLDSTRAAVKAEQQRVADSARAARIAYADSSMKARQHITDSIAYVRRRTQDSLEDLRRYRESRHYKDSVVAAKQRIADSINNAREAALAAERAERNRILDSTAAARKAISDSIKLVQGRIRDSLDAVKEYRSSKRYKDSVEFVKQRVADSISLARKVYNDSVTASRKRIADSTTAARTRIADSVAAVRQSINDSMAAARKARTDSLAVVKEAREKRKKAEDKKKEQKMNLAMELKIKQKREQWSNEKMLKKKWSGPRQLLQNTFTRYNYYFNAYNKMQEAKANMARVGRENYDSLIALYPFDPDKDSTSIAADMDSIIRKVSLGIQIHDPRVKWGDDLYLLLGEAYYYKGDYKNASYAFRYIIGMNDRFKKKPGGSASYKKKGQPSIVEEDKKGGLDFLKHKTVNNEAILWLSRTFTQAGTPENAEAVIDLVASDPKLPESLKGRLAMTRAFLMLSNNNMRDAAAQLKIAADDPYLPDDQRQRSAYLAAQIDQMNGDYAASNEYFQKTIDLHPNIEMDFYAHKNIAYNTRYSGQGQEEAIASLKKILKDYKYSNYYEQVYYILGNLASNSGSPVDAIGYLGKSVRSDKTTKKQKAISFAALGDLYYRLGDYVAAKSAYDSSALLAKYAPNDTLIANAVHRSNVLGSVTAPYTTIKTQDSMLLLASLSEREQRAIIRKHLKDLEQRQEDSAFNAENAGVNTVVQNEGNTQAGAGWYFSNSAQMKKGQSEFKRLWGNRPPVDNWRRTSAIGFANNSGGNVAGTTTEEEEENLQLDARGLPTEDALLAMIPNTPEKQQRANKLIQKAYVDLGDAYVMQLEDYQLADKALDTLDVRYRDHDDKARELYLRYMMAMRQNQYAEGQKYSQQLQQQYPASEYARLVKPTEDGANIQGTATGSVSNYYDETYSLLMQRQYTEVLQRVKASRQKYNDPKSEKRFRIMEGIALAGQGNYKEADTLLKDFIKGNGSDSLRGWAERVLEYVNKNKPAEPVNADTAKALPLNNTVVSNVNTNNNIDGTVTIAQPTGEVPPVYAYKPDAEHFVIVSFPGMQPRAMGAKSAIADFNTFRFPAQRLASNIDMLSKTEGVITTKKFSSAAQAKEYMNTLKAASQIFREYQSSEYQVFIISASNYQKLLADHGTQQYLNFYKFYYK
jgi:tetratricopeptide (TPR) repeat protein